MDAWNVVNLVVGAIGSLGGITGVVALFQAHNANKLAGKVVRKDTEDCVVDFSVRWDGGSGEVVFTNTGADDARQVTLLVNRPPLGEGIDAIHATGRFDTIPAGSHVGVAVSELVAEREEYDRFMHDTAMGRYMLVAGKRYGTTLSCDANWHTPLGFTRSKHLDLNVD
ncbi:hypothetical protein [Bifidobacterium pseudolongum]|uniref:hypothetical protein n=1 Tax=Bifidobacterium pseudolongum TaxID=1694 RepID=UPI00102184D0|nr:hypothetical protein [Bifidobacterium pseudolongum]